MVAAVLCFKICICTCNDVIKLEKYIVDVTQKRFKHPQSIKLSSILHKSRVESSVQTALLVHNLVLRSSYSNNKFLEVLVRIVSVLIRSH